MTTRHRIAGQLEAFASPCLAWHSLHFAYAKPPRAAASALSIALATFASGRLRSLYGERTYLVMAGLVMAGLVLALFAAALKRRIEA